MSPTGQPSCSTKYSSCKPSITCKPISDRLYTHNPPSTMVAERKLCAVELRSQRAIWLFVIILLPLYSLSSIRMPRLGNKRRPDQLANTRKLKATKKTAESEAVECESTSTQSASRRKRHCI